MNLKLIKTTFILAFLTSQFALASNTIFVSGKKAERLYNSLLPTKVNSADNLIVAENLSCTLMSSDSTCRLNGQPVQGNEVNDLILALKSIGIKSDSFNRQILETGKIVCDNQERIRQDNDDRSGEIVNEYTCDIEVLN